MRCFGIALGVALKLPFHPKVQLPGQMPHGQLGLVTAGNDVSGPNVITPV